MRISTSSMYEVGTTQLGTLQSQMAKTQQQLATNRRMLSAADDPIAAARAVEVSQSQAVNTQFATNRQNARSSLGQVELALADVTALLQDAQDIGVAAGNGTYSAAQREALATELSARADGLLALANSADASGGYLFGGYKSATVPFTQTAGGAQYNGDQGQRQLQVASARQLAVSDSGSAVFENNATGNGSFQTAAAAANSGTGIVSAGSVVDGKLATGHKYQVDFTVAGTPAVTSYSITDKSLVPAASAGPQIPYQAGQQIKFDGIVFDVTGAPANGDQFTVAPSQKQSVFTTLTEMIATLRAPVTDEASRTGFLNRLGAAQQNLVGAFDNVLTVQASVGARMKELDNLDSAGEDLNVQYTATLSGLQDLDFVKATSLFAQQKATLEAAQLSYKAMSGLSLFNFIR